MGLFFQSNNSTTGEARSSAGFWSCASVDALTTFPLPRFAGVTCARYLLLGALCRPPYYADLASPTPIAVGDRCDRVGIIIAPQEKPLALLAEGIKKSEETRTCVG